MLFRSLRNWAGRVRAWASQHLPPDRRPSINSLKERIIAVEADVKDLKASVERIEATTERLEASVERIEATTGRLEAGQDRLNSNMGELLGNMGELLGYCKDDRGHVLEQLCRGWSMDGFPSFWRKRMQGSPGAPHGQWVPRLRSAGLPWHDRRDHSEWEDFRADAQIPERLAAEDLPVDLQMRFTYEPADGATRSFLLLGEAARQPDGGDVKRLFDRRALLRAAGVDDPIVLCLFSQVAIKNPTALAQFEEHHILHLYRAPRLTFHSWEDDAQRKLRHVLGWNESHVSARDP